MILGVGEVEGLDKNIEGISGGRGEEGEVGEVGPGGCWWTP